MQRDSLSQVQDNQPRLLGSGPASRRPLNSRWAPQRAALKPLTAWIQSQQEDMRQDLQARSFGARTQVSLSSAQVADCKSWRSSRYPRRLIRCTFQLTCLIPVYLLRQERDQCPRPHCARCGSHCRGLAPQPEKLLLLSPAQTQVHMLPLRPRFCDADGPSDRWPGQWRGWPSLHQLCPPRGQETAPHPTAGPLGLTPPFLWQLHSC